MRKNKPKLYPCRNHPASAQDIGSLRLVVGDKPKKRCLKCHWWIVDVLGIGEK